MFRHGIIRCGRPVALATVTRYITQKHQLSSVANPTRLTPSSSSKPVSHTVQYDGRSNGPSTSSLESLAHIAPLSRGPAFSQQILFEIEDCHTTHQKKDKLDWNDSHPPIYKLDGRDVAEDSRNPHLFSHLPPPESWRDIALGRHSDVTQNFQTKSRYFMHNKDTIKTFVDRLDLSGISRQNDGKKLTVIEAYAGAGTITRELLMRPEVGRVITMENMYMAALRALMDDPTVVDPEGRSPRDKLLLVPGQSGFHWDVYDSIENSGLLANISKVKDDPSIPAHKLPPLIFVAQLPNTVHGDLLYTQLISAICNGQWLFKYGRVKTAFVMPEALAYKSLAQPGESARSKISTLSSILSGQEILLCNDPDLQPQRLHLYPPNLAPSKRYLAAGFISKEHQASGSNQKDLCAFAVVPKIRQAIAWKRLNGHIEVSAAEHEALRIEGQQLTVRVEAARLLQRIEGTLRSQLRVKPKCKPRTLKTDLKSETEIRRSLRKTLYELQAKRKRFKLAILKRVVEGKGVDKLGKPIKARKYSSKSQRTIPKSENEETATFSFLELREAVDRLKEDIVREKEHVQEALKTDAEQRAEPSAERDLRELQLTRQRYEERRKALRDILASGEDSNGILSDTEAMLDELSFAKSRTLAVTLADGNAEAGKLPPRPSNVITQGPIGIEFESLDYLLRALFILRTKSVAEALARTYPGAQSVLSRLAPPDYQPSPDAKWAPPAVADHQRIPIHGVPENVYIDPMTRVIDLTDDQWLALARTFERWPFRPEYLFDESKFQAPPGLTTSDRRQSMTFF